MNCRGVLLSTYLATQNNNDINGNGNFTKLQSLQQDEVDLQGYCGCNNCCRNIHKLVVQKQRPAYISEQQNTTATTIFEIHKEEQQQQYNKKR